jgi:hypothetical protein
MCIVAARSVLAVDSCKTCIAHLQLCNSLYILQLLLWYLEYRCNELVTPVVQRHYLLILYCVFMCTVYTLVHALAAPDVVSPAYVISGEFRSFFYSQFAAHTLIPAALL